MIDVSMDDMKPKKKKVISDMVVKPATKKTASVQKPILTSTKKNVVHEQVRNTKYENHIPTHRKIISEPVYKETIQEDVFEDQEEDFSLSSDTITYSQHQSIDMDEILRNDRKYGGCLLWFIALVCVIGITLGIGALFARTRVTITLKQWTGSVDQTVDLAQNPGAGQIAFATETQTFTDDVVVPSVGTSATSSKAFGSVRFYNTNTSSKTIPAGTIIISSKNISYTTTQKITVPAAQKKNLGQIDAKIIAVNDGADANDGLDDFTFSSKNFSGITIHSVTSISGGGSANTQTADPDQIATAQTQITQYFSDPSVFIARMTNEIPSTMMVLPIQIVPASPNFTTDGTKSDGVHITGNESITLLIVSKSDVAAALGKQLNIPNGIATIVPSFNNLTVTTATALAAGAIPQTMSIHISGTALVTGFVDGKKVQSSLVGISRKQAHHILDTTPEIQAYTLSITPFWRRILPTNTDQITVVLK